MSEKTVTIVRLYADEAGVSHYAEDTVGLKATDYAPPAAPLEVSEPEAAKRFVFVGGPPGWEGDWHPSPYRQMVFVLSGCFAVGASDGETRSFGPGAALLLEDTVGKGHHTKVVSAEYGLTVMVHLE
jgi:quercetin dioxygenase-like cupin family protein